MQRIRVEEDGCWRWLGTITTKGYGQVCWQGKRYQAHRLFYELFIGPIPDGMTLDHKCRHRWCVNPECVEPVLNRENIMRGTVPSANRAVCKNGRHDITAPGSIYIDSDGTERCHACRLESKRRYARGMHPRSPHSRTDEGARSDSVRIGG
jgi:hypothetical protein